MPVTFPPDYPERLYAGVLGKIIGVFVGRPFEGASYERLTREVGEVRYYVNDCYKAPLIVADDDISGTFTFLRALEDHGYPQAITAEQIGETWLNYLVEGRTVLWWGGLGNSTEHTAYLRLKHGLKAPLSGAIATNGQIVAEQIGAQIFIDGWGLVSPGDPAQAARLAKEAGSVSHDGEAVYGAQIVAALVAMAFVEKDLHKMLDAALAQIPADCLIAQVIADVRAWVPQDREWRITRQRIQEKYGYDKYGGNCHMIPNHALIMLALLYAPDDFSQAMLIVNTSGWDTDCNSANVGCIMGVRLGVAGINRHHDWIGPVADRVLVPTADGGSCISDAGAETVRVLRTAYALAGKPFDAPKQGARYHFAFPHCVQGFLPILSNLGVPTAQVANAAWPDDPQRRALAIQTRAVGDRHVAGAFVGTFFQPEQLNQGGYGLLGSPQIYTGQQIAAQVLLDAKSPPVKARLAVIHYHGEKDEAKGLAGEWTTLVPGRAAELLWTLPDTAGQPIYQLRVEFQGPPAQVYVDCVEVRGMPHTPLFATAEKTGAIWRKAWVDATHACHPDGSLGGHGLRIMQNEGAGLLAIGSAAWRNYRFEATARPHLAESFGVAVAYRGLTRNLQFTLHRDGTARLTRVEHAARRELARAPFPFKLYEKYVLAVEWTGPTLRCSVNGADVFPAVPLTDPPAGGGVALLVTEGRVLFAGSQIRPA